MTMRHTLTGRIGRRPLEITFTGELSEDDKAVISAEVRKLMRRAIDDINFDLAWRALTQRYYLLCAILYLSGAAAGASLMQMVMRH